MKPRGSEWTQPYIYTPLKGPRYIRLINLDPASDPDAPLHCSLLQADYAELEGQYESVSYHWGDPASQLPVYLNQRYQLSITRNLHQALRRLRLQHGSRLLWADAVCINQSDAKEKEVQIPLMVRIFRGARRVLAWLGPAARNSDEQLGMHLLDRLSRQPRDEIEAIEKYLGGGAWDRATMTQALLEVTSKFFSLAWFSRLWIVQEVVFNLDVLLICGVSELPWMRVVSAVSILNNIAAWESHTVARQKLDAIDTIAGLWKYYCNLADLRTKDILRNTRAAETGSDDIIQLMQKFSEYNCADPRDRIFALYSMTPDIQPTTSAAAQGPTGPDMSAPRECSLELWSMMQGKLPSSSAALPDTAPIYMDADYTLDVQETYKVFATACMQAGRIKPILAAALSRTGPSLRAHWPWWVPDWRIRPTTPAHLPGDFHFSRVANDSLEVYVHGQWQDPQLPAIDAVLRRPLPSDTTAYTSIMRLVTAVCRERDKASSFLTGLLVVEPLMKQLAQSKDPPEYLESLEILLTQRSFFSASVPSIESRRHVPYDDGVGPEKRFVGCGTTALMPGDVVIDLYSDKSGPLQEPYLIPALILRPMRRVNRLDFFFPYSCRIVGTAYVSCAWSEGSRQVPSFWSSVPRKMCLE